MFTPDFSTSLSTNAIRSTQQLHIIEQAGGKAALGKTRNLLRQYKETLFLTDRQKSIGMGILLGDASLQTQDNGLSYRLKYEGGNKHLSYIQSLHKEFDEWCLSDLACKDRIHPKTKTSIRTWEFQTLSHSRLNYFSYMFLDENRKKRVPENLFENPYFTAQSLAYWIMDDGGKMDYTENQGKGVEIHTQGFKKEEVEYLCEGLQKKYNLNSWVKTKKRDNKAFIAISGNSFETLMGHIELYMHPDMYHKLPTGRKIRESDS